MSQFYTNAAKIPPRAALLSAHRSPREADLDHEPRHGSDYRASDPEREGVRPLAAAGHVRVRTCCVYGLRTDWTEYIDRVH